MNMKINIIIVVTTFFLIGCNHPNKRITQQLDYNQFLEINEHEMLSIVKSDMEFWGKKLEKDSNQFPYMAQMAASQSHLFNLTGEIDYLIEAEKNLTIANRLTNYNNASYLRSLAKNYISQHKFKEALSVLKLAEAIGERLRDTQKMMFDVHLELGNNTIAKTYLEKIVDFSEFDFLIRLSKWSDHNGNLEGGIKYLEKAVDVAESSNNDYLKQWAYTNLADFFGHDGQIKKSYENYLKALELDPNNAYAKKGIAWIVYSHERNPNEALRILKSILQNQSSPDYHLLRAEIAEFLGEVELKEKSLIKFYSAIQNKKYGDMYNKYNSLLLAEEFNKIDKALELAKTEVEIRPTPQSYDLLAWVIYNNGEYEKALKIMEDHVINKTHEPEAKYHLAEIYKANGLHKKAKAIKKELLKSSFELGPLTAKKVVQL